MCLGSKIIRIHRIFTDFYILPFYSSKFTTSFITRKKEILMNKTKKFYKNTDGLKDLWEQKQSNNFEPN